MNKKLKKCTLLTLSAFACAAIGISAYCSNNIKKTSAETVYTYTFDCEVTGWSTSGGTKTVDDVVWTYGSASYLAKSGTIGNGVQIGSNKNPASSWTISTPISSFGTTSTIKSIKIKASTGGEANYTIKANGTSVKTGSLTTTSTFYEASGLAVTSGKVEVTMSDATKAMYLKSITVSYTKTEKELRSISISGNVTKKNYYDGQVLDPTGLVATGIYEDESEEDITKLVTWTFNPETLSTGTESCGVTATLNSISSDEFTVSGLTVSENPFLKFTIVSDASEINVNSIYGLSFDGVSFVGKQVDSKTISMTNSFSDVGFFKFVPNENNNGYYLTFQTNTNSLFNLDKFICNNSTKTDLSSTNDKTNATNDWSYEANGDGVIVKHNSRFLGLYTDGTYIKAYASITANAPVYLYKYNDELLNWSESFMNELTCDATGATAPSVEKWNALASTFENLSDEQKATAKALVSSETGNWSEQAVAKYDYILGKYKDGTYTNFIDRDISSSNSINPMSVNSTNIAIIITIASVLAISATAAIIVYKKKKAVK